MSFGATDVFINKFVHLKDKPREKEALQILQRVASLVKPIMRKHNWRLPVLAEFYPKNISLLGININGGAKICLRLRPHYDEGAFLEEGDIIGTMLHELTHNVRGPHDQTFYKILSQLEDEFDALQRSGYSGEGFFSPGVRVGQGMSHDLPPHLAKERALAAAEKRRQVSVVLSGGGRLGGRGVVGKSPRELAAEAAERRAQDERTCASGEEGVREAEQAANEGVEHDAIPNKGRSNSPEIILLDPPPRSIAGPSGSSTLLSTSGIQKRRPPKPTSASGSKTLGPSSRARGSTSSTGTNDFWVCESCTLINENSVLETCTLCSSPRVVPNASYSDSKKAAPRKDVLARRDTSAAKPSGWSCFACTFVNREGTLQCGVCASTRPISSATASWMCMSCGQGDNDHQFWTCRSCGWVKAQS